MAQLVTRIDGNGEMRSAVEVYEAYEAHLAELLTLAKPKFP